MVCFGVIKSVCGTSCTRLSQTIRQSRVGLPQEQVNEKESLHMRVAGATMRYHRDYDE